MNELKSLFKGKQRDDFWKKIVTKNISLITVDESPETDITKEDAKLVTIHLNITQKRLSLVFRCHSQLL
jgi:hypothetical protein